MNILALSWKEANFQYLLDQVKKVRQRLEQKIDFQSNQSTLAKFEPPDQSTLAKFEPHLAIKPTDAVAQIPFALEQLCAIFRLSAFERDILLLCVGMELDHNSFSSLCSTVQEDPEQNYPTLGLVLEKFDQPQRGILSCQSALQEWQLIEIGAGQTLTKSPIRIDQRILCYLLGEPCWDNKLGGIVQPIQTTTKNNTLLSTSERVLVDNIVATCFGTTRLDAFPIAQLCGTDVAAKRSLAAAACASVGYNLNAISATVLPSHPHELYHLQKRWNREALLTKSALLLECDWGSPSDPVQETNITQFIQGIHSPLIVSRQDRQSSPSVRPSLAFEVPLLSHSDQLRLWQTELGAIATDLNGYVERLVAQFNLKTDAIATVCAAVKSHLTESSLACFSPEAIFHQLWDLCRTMARPQLDELAQRIDCQATRNDIVLPEEQQQTLKEIVAHVEHRDLVYWQWGFADKQNRGLGISVLFNGPPGTGKTTAAEMLAEKLRLDLYRIDISQVSDKYIGETEKKLRRIFDAAEAGGIVLLFDEADALFSKRTEVKDSHDRYANAQVSYLLQRIEAYQGLAILTTNLKGSIDQAFLRRLRFVVNFPFPDHNLRCQIWQRSFPKDTLTHELDFDKLAQLNMAGGNLSNIALNACMKTAQAGRKAVTMEDVLSVTRSEYSKMEKSLTSAETQGWV